MLYYTIILLIINFRTLMELEKEATEAGIINPRAVDLLPLD